jgi:hypothetical protein
MAEAKNTEEQKLATIERLRAEATQRLAEIQGNGCEAASARAFELGRLSALEEMDWRQQPS